MIRPGILAFAAMVLASGCSTHGVSTSPASASIPFPEFGEIRDWRSDGTTGLYIESDSRQWYYATFLAPCEALPYAQHIGFRTVPPFPLDTFDSIKIYHTQCYFKTLDRVQGPPGASPSPAPAKPSS
jgi:hypothetical protein